MNMEERGVYHTCLNLAWLNDGIPADPSELARLLKLPVKRLNKLWERVGRCFEVGPNGTLVNPRQERDRTGAIERSNERAESGKLGASRRWHNHSSAIAKPSSTDSSAILRAYDYVSVSESVVTAEGKQCAEADPDLDTWAASIYDRWKKYRDRVLALQALCDLTCSREQFEASYAKWLDYHERMGWQYAPTLASFLHDRTYEHEPPQLGETARRKSAADEAWDRVTERIEREEG